MRECDPRPYPEEKALYKERSPINSLDTWKTATAFFQVGLSSLWIRHLCSRIGLPRAKGQAETLPGMSSASCPEHHLD